MADFKGYIPCGFCSQIAEVFQASGKRKDYFTKCANCGTDQRAGKKIQEHIIRNHVKNREEIEEVKEEETEEEQKEQKEIEETSNSECKNDRPAGVPGVICVEKSEQGKPKNQFFLYSIFGGIGFVCIKLASNFFLKDR